MTNVKVDQVDLVLEKLAYVVGYLEAQEGETPPKAKKVVRPRMKDGNVSDAYKRGHRDGLTEMLKQAVEQGYPRHEVSRWVEATRAKRLSHDEFILLLRYKLKPELIRQRSQEIKLVLAKLSRAALA